jgi:threonine/homoserine/homoserine lactone efflux protein
MFVLVTLFMPGPNNTMLLAAAALSFGFRCALPP